MEWKKELKHKLKALKKLFNVTVVGNFPNLGKYADTHVPETFQNPNMHD
jgi:hypothetical protein